MSASTESDGAGQFAESYGGIEKDFYDAPVPLLDATTGNTDIVARLTFIFDQRLSPQLLESSWYKLVQEWPILAARLRESRTAPSGLVYRIPTREALQRQVAREASLPLQKRQFIHLDETHRIVCTYFAGLKRPLPEIKGESGIFLAEPPEWDDQVRWTAYNGVQNQKEYLQSDRPIVTICATSFQDATMITYSVTHVIGDGFATRGIMEAWGQVIRGEPIRSQLKFGHDNLIDLLPAPGSRPPATLPLNYRMLYLRDKLRLIGNMAKDVLIDRPERTVRQRYIFIPEATLRAMQDQAKEELVAAHTASSGSGAGAPGVSRSDVLLAFVVKNLAVAQPAHWQLTPITIVSARGKGVKGLAEFSFPNNFFNLAAAVPLASLECGQVAAMPLGVLALQIRTEVQKQATPENFQNLFSSLIHYSTWRRSKGYQGKKDKADAINDDGGMLFFGPPDHRFAGVTDWRGIKFPTVDFTGASLNGGPKNPVRTRAMNTHMICPMSRRDRFACIGEIDGGVWLGGSLSENEWKNERGFGQYKVVRNDPRLGESSKNVVVSAFGAAEPSRL